MSQPPTLRLVPIPKNITKEMTVEEKLTMLKGKLAQAIIAREMVLKDATEVLMSDLGAAQVRLDKSPGRGKFGDIRTGLWYETATQLDTLQDVLGLVESLLEGGNGEGFDRGGKR